MKYPLPFRFLIEGGTASKRPKDRSIDFKYFDATGKAMYQGSLVGTVIDVQAQLAIAKGNGGGELKNIGKC